MDSPAFANPTPRDVLRTVFRHGRRMVVIFVTISVATVLAVIAWPRAYESEAKLLIRVGRESVTLDPTATTGQTIAMQRFQEEVVNSILEILNSRQIKEAIVDRVGADAILHGVAGSGGGETAQSNVLRDWAAAAKNAAGDFVDRVVTGVGIKESISDRERAIRRLEKKFHASAKKRSTVATIIGRAKTPQLAQQIIATATKAFLELHVQMSRTEGSHAFFLQQAERLHGQLEEAYEQLRDRKNEYGLINVESKRGILRDEIGDVELALLAVERDLRFSQTKLEKLLASMNRLPAEIVSETVNVSNLAHDGMRQQLYDLETKEQELLARRTANHPSVRKIQSQRENIQRILDAQPQDRENSTQVPNPIKKDLEAEVLREQAQNKALVSRQAALVQQQKTLRRQLETLNRQEVELALMERKTELLEATYQADLDKLEQARIDDELDQQAISSINVAQPASFVEKPVSPKKKIVLLAGLVLAILSSASYAVAAESFDQTLRTPEQVEAALELPVLATVPRVGRRGGKSRRSAATTAPPAVAEPHYQALAGRLRGSRLERTDGGCRTAVRVGVMHCTPDAHDGSVATQLAINARDLQSDPVLLVDADVAHRAVGNRFGANGSPGLCEILHGETDVGTCVLDAGVENLSVLAAGGAANHSLPLRDMSSLARRLDGVAAEYGLIVIDLPAPSASGAEIAAAAEMDAVVLAVEAESTRIHTARRIQQQLSAAGANVLGVVLNGRRYHIPEWLYRRI